MRYLARRVACAIVVVLLAGGLASAQSVLRVNESQVRIQVREDSAVVDLPIESTSPATISARILLQLVDPSGTARERASRDASLPRGATRVRIPMPPVRPSRTDPAEWTLYWYRLRYSVTASPAAQGETAQVTGILSVGLAAPDIFELHVAVPAMVKPGGRYLARVRAIHPVTGRPVAGVAVQAAIHVDSDDAANGHPLQTKPAATDRRGFARLDFVLPEKLESDDFEVTVTGKLGGFSAEAEGKLLPSRRYELSLNTDKLLYQPGQMLHARLLAFDPGKKAFAGRQFDLSILDPDDSLVYRTSVQTSSFGIASADWQIPENLRLGSYTVRAEFSEDSTFFASASVKISRYELPAFSVAATPDRPYYLADQNASVEIRADYLFGEPVSRGHVRVVREAERDWNYREQRWDTKEGESYEGDTDSRGRYMARIDLAADQRALAAEDYSRFRDLSFAAYFTDSSTGRTERRPFNLRISKEAIHIYVIEPSNSRSARVPLDLYVSTDYPDGTPASCDVEFAWLGSKRGTNAAPISQTVLLPLRRVHTNRYGLARISGLKPPQASDLREITLHLDAHDRKGSFGRHSETLWYSDSPGLRIETNKTLYKQGELIRVRLDSSEPGLTVVLEALRDFRVLASKLVRIPAGTAFVEFVPNEGFQDAVTIVGYAFGLRPGSEYHSDAVFASHTVLFPRNHELKVEARFPKSVYRPGEQAFVDLQVTAPDGRQAKSALGLAVIDRAVAQRQRTDSDFGPARESYDLRSRWYEDSEIAGVHRSDLDKLDLSKPLPDGLELVAEVLLQQEDQFPNLYSSSVGSPDPLKLFALEINPRTQSIRSVLARRYVETGEFPTVQSELDDFLLAAGIYLEDTKDPWGTPYRASFRIDREFHVLDLVSAGPDKTAGTEDDFVALQMKWPYFKPMENLLRKAVDQYHARTGGFIRDTQSLKAELARLGADLGAWKDPWGHPYQVLFGIDESEFTVTVNSAGPDGRFDSKEFPSDDDFRLARIDIDYFAAMRAQISEALKSYFQATQVFPQNLDQLRKALAHSGIDWDALRDAWNHHYYATFRRESRFSDRISIETYQEYLQSRPVQRVTTIPVTQDVDFVYIRSAGPDGLEGTGDDFSIASFSRDVVSQSSRGALPAQPGQQAILAGATGAIAGTVVDPSGAAVAGAQISAQSSDNETVYTTQSGAGGSYLLPNLPAGLYTVRITATGFQISSFTRVPVASSNVTRVNATLTIGAATTTVEVSANRIELQTSTSAIASRKLGKATVLLTQQAATPRLRQNFPETLLWKPEVITDAGGHARLTFPLADNITTWTLSAVASTLNGEIGAAEKEIRAFQPFFVEHDPPRFLTVGDEIALPVVLRNYTHERLHVDVAMKPSDWFAALSPPLVKTQIPPGDFSRDIFRFRAVSTAKAAKQQVDAVGAGVSDAVSRTVVVRPDGEERTESTSQVFAESVSLDLIIPANAIPGSIETAVKLYPNLNAHLLESIEAILRRPYGCAEQTISSAYPGVLLLKYASGTGEANSPIRTRARRYAELGYQRLLSYRAPSGGFSYWGKDDPDLALTAYALQFLGDESEFVPVDASLAADSLDWIRKQAQPDGRWIARDWTGNEDPRRSVLLTAYVARVLTNFRITSTDTGNASQMIQGAHSLAVPALAYLRSHVEAYDEPYLIASYALASLGAGDSLGFQSGIERLRKLEHREGDSSYWSLETNTPFYGWGMTGRLETTALVLEALAGAQRSRDSDAQISRGLLFLLRHQDRYGVWYSSQATINVLKAMASFIARGDGGLNSAAGSERPEAAVLVDGKPALSIDLPPANALSAPLTADLSKFVTSGAHRVEIRRPAGVSRASAQLLAEYYVPWSQGSAPADFRREDKGNEALRLSVHFDKESANVDETIHCSVSAERIGFRGYGMMLAEIGLPPGAEVDRNSLDTAIKSSGWDINGFDVLPDRLIVYLWPHAGGTRFSFSFKPRFGLKALTAPSILYDYYNPEARTLVAPSLFVVQ